MRTFSLGAGADVVKFTVKDADNESNITNFTVSGTNFDKLSFAKTVFDGLGNLAESGALTSVGSSDKSVDAAATTVYKDTYANLKNLQGSSGNGNVGKVVVAVATDADDKGGIYAVTLKDASDATSIVKVGTLTGVNLDTLTMANFETAA